MKNNFLHIKFLVFLKLGFLTLFLFFAMSQLQAQEVKATIDRDSLKIGEQIKYEIEVKTKEASKVVFPQGQSFMPLEVVDSLAVDTLVNKDSNLKLKREFPLTQFDSGAYTIPKQTVIIDGDGFDTESFDVYVSDVEIDTTKQKLYPIKDALDINPTLKMPTWLWWLIGILTLAILVYVFFKTREKIKESKRELPPYEKAIQTLTQLDESQDLESGNMKEYYSTLSLAIKRYIDEKADERALESTTDEFIELLRAYKKKKQLYLKPQVIDSIDAVLKRADLSKFAGIHTDKLTAKEDRKTIEQNIHAFDQVIPEPTEEEKLLNEDYRKAQEQKEKNKQLWIRIGMGVVIVLIGLSVFVGIKGTDYAKSLVSPNPTEKLLKGDWVKSEYGTFGMTINAPDVLTRSTDTLPEVFAGKTESEERFSFGDLHGKFSTQVTNIRLKKDAQLDSIDVGNLLDNELNADDIGTFTFKDEEFTTLNSEKGQRVNGTFSVDRPKGRSSKRKAYTFIVLGERGGIQELLITHDEDDENAEKIKRRIINSIEYNRENDG